MGKLTKIVVGMVGVTVALGLLHGLLNLGWNPGRALGLSKAPEVAEETRFRVGFLPVT